MNKFKLLYKVWKGRRAQKRYNISNRELAEVFVKAKQSYEDRLRNGDFCGMCWSISDTLFQDVPYRYQQQTKNKFYQSATLFCSEFLIDKKLSYNHWWWPKSEKKERLVAFDKLITLYSADKIIITIFNVEIKL